MAKIIKVINGKLDGYTPENTTTNKNNKKIGILSPYSQRKVINAISVAQAKTDRVSYTGGARELFNYITNEPDNIVNGEFGPLLLKVRKGKRVLNEHYCAQCKRFEKSLWRYQDSNYGVVYLCTICKATAFERTFGHADAMPLKVDHAHAHKGKW